MKQVYTRFTLVTVLALAAAVFLFEFPAHSIEALAQKAPDAKPAVLVSAAAAERKDIPIEIETIGTVQAAESVAVRARIDSQIIETHFKDGSEIKKDDLLFVLDDRSLNAQLRQLEAALARDRAQLANLKIQYERKKKLADKGYETVSNLDDARAVYEVQAATVHASEAALENLKVQLAYTRITAPISGRAGTIRVTTGNTVKANDTDPLVTINQIKPIKAQMALPQKYFDAVRKALSSPEGIVVSARHEGADTEQKGRLEYIDNTLDQATGTFQARAVFDNNDEELWPGMFVNLRITLGTEKQALTVPVVAIQHGQDGDFVFALVNGKAEKRPVKVNRVQNTFALIDTGVKEGEQVAIDGLMKLEDGTPVSISGAAKTGITP